MTSFWNIAKFFTFHDSLYFQEVNVSQVSTVQKVPTSRHPVTEDTIALEREIPTILALVTPDFIVLVGPMLRTLEEVMVTCALKGNIVKK